MDEYNVWLKLTYVGFRAHVEIASRIVSYRMSLNTHTALLRRAGTASRPGYVVAAAARCPLQNMPSSIISLHMFLLFILFLILNILKSSNWAMLWMQARWSSAHKRQCNTGKRRGSRSHRPLERNILLHSGVNVNPQKLWFSFLGVAVAGG